MPDLENVGIAYQQAGVFYRNLGLRLASSNPSGRGEAGSEYWYRKSLDALLRSEKIELAQDERNRAENARRGKPGLTFVPSALYLQMGRTYQKLGDRKRAVEAFERGRALESDPDLLEELAAEYRTAGEAGRLPWRWWRRWRWIPGGRDWRTSLWNYTRKSTRRDAPSAARAERSGLNVDCPLVHGDICTASRNVARTYLRTWQHAHAEAIRRTAIQELGCAPELLN